MVDETDAPAKSPLLPPFGLRLRLELREKIVEAARMNGRSVNSEISNRLEQSFEKVNLFDEPDKVPSSPQAREALARVEAVEGEVARLKEQFAALKKLL